MICDATLIFVLIGFNIWNWYMAICGITTIEFWNRLHMLPNEDLYDYSYDRISDNLFIIFGTHKWFRILSPSLRALPFCGIEFSY